jgi:hypothetical protein
MSLFLGILHKYQADSLANIIFALVKVKPFPDVEVSALA